MLDLIVIGAGPAGCSAALTARMRNLNTLVIYSGDGALDKAHQMDNYPGLPQVTGPDLLQKMRAHLAQMGIESKRALAQKILPGGPSFSVLAGNEVYESRAVILACGAARVSLLAGEEQWLGQGVSYCATCDGMFYRGKRIAVIAGGPEAVEEANFLAELGHVIYFVEKAHDSTHLASGIERNPNKPLEIKKTPQGMEVVSAQGSVSVDGVFVLRPTIALNQLLPELAMEKSAVQVNRNCMTNIPGAFAAGDMTGNPMQIAKAIGEGNIAAIAAAAYIRSLAEAAAQA